MLKRNLFVISASSGAGKSSLIKELCRVDSCLQVSISYTSRHKRFNEIDGVDYNFIDKDMFLNLIKENKFLEYALVYDNYYGTHVDILNTINNSNNNHDIILEIDYQGAMQIKEKFSKAILIYILPPSVNELEKRLKKRNTDDIDTINKRLKYAKEESTNANNFNHIVINDNFSDAVDKLLHIIQSYR